MKIRRFGVSSCLLAILGVVLAAADTNGDEMDFVLEWAPLGTFNTGTATGTATIDTDVLQGTSFFDELIVNTGFTDIEVVVSGTTGDGTFSSGNGELTTLIWQTVGPVDFTTELVGQANLTDFNLGQIVPGSAPIGVGPFTFATSGGEQFLLTSFAPAAAIPEPSSMAALAIGGLAVATRRKRRR